MEKRYMPILQLTSRFDRRSVSYQLNKHDTLHSWLKYKEGFSADLVNVLLDDMGAVAGDTIMDPFMGSGTTALVCQMRGINSIGYDILPISAVSINAKASVAHYSIEELKALIAEFGALTLPKNYEKTTPYITITRMAYPVDNAKLIQFATDWINDSCYSKELKNLFTLCVLNSLEKSSYTAKSGQYLRWDSRSKKIMEANQRRKAMGRPLIPEYYCRDIIFNAKDVIYEELNRVLDDVILLQPQTLMGIGANIDFRQASALMDLPRLEANTLKGVISSPPYCNRYDYTRTYALELVYLGADEHSIKEMRQDLLSCTVESKSKVEALRGVYEKIGALDRFNSILKTIGTNKALSEVLNAMKVRKANGDLNNQGVARMIEGYFTELAFIYAELYRISKKGAYVALVNDNVRYGGEVIPVDFLSTSLAEQFGFTPIAVYCLKQQKGNSSQQMKKYGRVPLRKSITIWEKK